MSPLVPKMVIRSIFLFLLTLTITSFLQRTDFRVIAKFKHGAKLINIYKNTCFTGKVMEILYKIDCTENKNQRIFYIRKTDADLQEKTLSNFALVEEKTNGTVAVYPFGWENDNIYLKEIEDNCVLILEFKVSPINP